MWFLYLCSVSPKGFVKTRGQGVPQTSQWFLAAQGSGFLQAKLPPESCLVSEQMDNL